MALIRCKECGAQVSDLAQSCPNCGCPVAYSLGAQTELNLTPPPVFDPAAPVPAPEPVQQSVQQSTQQSLQMPDPYTAPQPVTYSGTESSGGGKIPGNNKRIALICGICLGAVALLVGAFFLIRSLMDPSGPSVYYPPSYNNYQGTQGASTNTEPLDTASSSPTVVMMLSSLKGDWTSSFMDTVTFEAVDGETVRRHRQYDYDRSSWMETSCTVREITEDTVTYIHEDGVLESVFYSVSEDEMELTLDGICYRKVTDVPDATMKQYMATGIPAFGNTYFGMTKEEVTRYANSGYRFTSETGTDFYHLPAMLSNQTSGFVTYRFDDRERLQTVTVYLDEDADAPEKYEALLLQVPALYTKWHGEGRESNNSYYNTYCTWEYESVKLRYSESDDLNVTLSFELTKSS